MKKLLELFLIMVISVIPMICQAKHLDTLNDTMKVDTFVKAFNINLENMNKNRNDIAKTFTLTDKTIIGKDRDPSGGYMYAYLLGHRKTQVMRFYTTADDRIMGIEINTREGTTGSHHQHMHYLIMLALGTLNTGITDEGLKQIWNNLNAKFNYNSSEMQHIDFEIPNITYRVIKRYDSAMKSFNLSILASKTSNFD